MENPVKKTINNQTDEAKPAFARQALRRKKGMTGAEGLLTVNELNGLMLLIDRANDLREAQTKALMRKA